MYKNKTKQTLLNNETLKVHIHETKLSIANCKKAFTSQEVKDIKANNHTNIHANRQLWQFKERFQNRIDVEQQQINLLKDIIGKIHFKMAKEDEAVN